MITFMIEMARKMSKLLRGGLGRVAGSHRTILPRQELLHQALGRDRRPAALRRDSAWCGDGAEPEECLQGAGSGFKRCRVHCLTPELSYLTKKISSKPAHVFPSRQPPFTDPVT